MAEKKKGQPNPQFDDMFLSDSPVPTSAYVPELGLALDFTADDLKVNALGRLSERQVAALHSRGRRITDLAWRIILWSVGGIIVFYMLAELLSIGPGSALVYAGLGAVIATAVLGMDTLERRKLDMDMRGPGVAMASGLLVAVAPNGPKDAERFEIGPGQRETLCVYSGMPCSLYYLRRTHILLSIGLENEVMG